MVSSFYLTLESNGRHQGWESHGATSLRSSIEADSGRMSKSSVSGGSASATSPIKSIQRGVLNASSVSITHVDPEKSELRVLGGVYAYAYRLGGGGGTQSVVDPVIASVSFYLTLDSNGNGITRVGSRATMSYELTELN